MFTFRQVAKTTNEKSTAMTGLMGRTRGVY